jgi:hypothetical protein
MESDPDAVLPASESAYYFLKERGREEDAEEYRRRAQGRYNELEQAREERAAVVTGGDFRPHGLPDEAVEAVRTQLARHDDLKSAYLVRRTMRHLDDEWPLYVVFVVPQRKLWAPLGGTARSWWTASSPSSSSPSRSGW